MTAQSLNPSSKLRCCFDSQILDTQKRKHTATSSPKSRKSNFKRRVASFYPTPTHHPMALDVGRADDNALCGGIAT